MASLKKKPKKPVKKPAKKPASGKVTGALPSGEPRYDVFAPRYGTVGDLDTAARQRAQAQIQPQLDQAGIERGREAGAHRGREQDLTKWYGAASDQAQKQYGLTASALGGLVQGAGDTSQNAQDILAGAMREGQNRQENFDQMLGGPKQDVFDEQALAAGAANSATNRTQLTNMGLAGLSAEAGRNDLIGTGMIQQQEAEGRRHRGILDDITNTERAAQGKLGGLINTSRSELEDDEFQRQLAVKQFGEARANRLFQQYMAGKEFGLKEKSESFQEWLGHQQVEIDKGAAKETHRANVANETNTAAGIRIDQQRANQEGAKIIADAEAAKGTADEDKLKLRASRYQRGVDALSAYLAPLKSEQNKQGVLRHTKKGGPTVYSQRLDYTKALRMLKGQIGMGDVEARQLIAATLDDPGWVRRANREIQHIRRLRKYPKSKGITKSPPLSSLPPVSGGGLGNLPGLTSSPPRG